MAHRLFRYVPSVTTPTHRIQCACTSIYVLVNNVFFQVYAQFGMAHNPLCGSNVISKSVGTQCKTCLAITPTTTFILISLEMLCAYTCEDIVMQNLIILLGLHHQTQGCTPNHIDWAYHEKLWATGFWCGPLEINFWSPTGLLSIFG